LGQIHAFAYFHHVIANFRNNMMKNSTNKLLLAQKNERTNSYLRYPIPQSGGYANTTKEININTTFESYQDRSPFIHRFHYDVQSLK
jgi:hypothetical protein